MKSTDLDAFWNKPKIVVEGQELELAFYSDLCPITLKKQREWTFLTNKL